MRIDRSADIVDILVSELGTGSVVTGSSISPDYTHDETLTAVPCEPLAVVVPNSTDEVCKALCIANQLGVPVTARGSGTGLSGAAVPLKDGIVVSFEKMDSILEIDTANHVAVVQAGVTLEQLDAECARHGLVYPVFPGEMSGSLGGNVSTNAGGMRAVKYGVTRQNVLGLQAVLATGEVISTGGKYVKASTGYDLTQLIVGSEGTLALVTEVTLKLQPRPPSSVTVLAPFVTLNDVTSAIPVVVQSGIGPTILEYIDILSMGAITASADLDLGIPEGIRQNALAYLVVVLESAHDDRLQDDSERLAQLLSDLGALDVYVLPASAAAELISAREKAFFVAKAAGAHDIVDVVVPRGSMHQYMEKVSELAQSHAALVAGCGHAGDGNVHLSVFQPDEAQRQSLLKELFKTGMALGGAISAEHGVGTEKKRYFMELEDPVKIELMKRVKAAFDPNGILNPGRIFD